MLCRMPGEGTVAVNSSRNLIWVMRFSIGNYSQILFKLLCHFWRKSGSGTEGNQAVDLKICFYSFRKYILNV